MPSPAAADLAELFSKARLSLKIPSSLPSTPRSVVFFDEVLNVEAILTLPSDPLLPIASSSAQGAVYSQALPLPALPVTASLGHQSIPPHLNALLACIHVNLLTDYVPQQSSSSAHLNKSTNPYEPLSSVQRQFEHLQLLPSHNPHADPNQTHHTSVRAFSNAWAGNQPPKPHRTLKDEVETSIATATGSSHRAYLTQEAQHWSVHWHCRVPINYLATPFQPLLSVTAALTLRLDHALLDHFLPASSSKTFVRSGFAHSLLTPLHEGPVYPDESPLQSQARAKASSALGLDGPNGLGSYLAHLSKDVVGGNNTVITPRSGSSALHAIQSRRSEALSGDAARNKLASRPSSNGDLASFTSRPTSGHNLTPTQSSQGTSRSQLEQEQQQSPGLQIYKRSTRQVLPLKTGLNVRMRTLVTQYDPHVHRRPSSHQPSAELESTRLVLSVELENPMESESSFVVNDIQIKIEQSQADQQDSHQILAKALQPMATVLPIQLTRGSQHNMLFYVSVEADHAQHDPRAGGLDHRAAGARNITITVSGRPQGEQEQLADFDSQWNCALDLAPVLSDAAKRDFIAKGPFMGRVDQPAAGPVAGNAQYSASSLRAAALGPDRSSYTHADHTRTPRSGHLGLGFPPPLRTAPARHDSTAIATTSAPSSELLHAQTSTSFLDKAKARATRTRSASHSATKSIRPWMSTPTGIREAAGGGLVVLSTIRRAGASTRDAAAEREVKFESSLGEDGVARPSVSTGAKTLPPTSIPVSTADERAVRFQTGDTAMVDLAILYKSGAAIVDEEADAIADMTLSWTQPSPSSTSHDVGKAGNRDSIDTTAGLVKGRLMDADSARLKSSLLTSQAETLNGLIPVQDHLSLQASILPSQSRTISMGLRCLSPGYHAIPPLQLHYQSMSGGRETVSLDGLGHVFVTPAAVL